LLYLPLYVAMEQGLFAKRGLDVHLVFAGNDDQIFAAVMSGAAQFGIGDPVFTAISHDKGGPGKVVAMMITKLGLGGVTNEAKVPQITSLKQLDGLRVSSFAAPSTTYTLLSEIKKQNHLKNMQIVQAPFGGQIATLEAGKADIATDIEPSVSIAENKGYRVVFDLGKWTQAQAITGVTTMEGTIKAHPKLVQKVVDAIQEAIDLMYAKPAICYKVGQKIYPNLPAKVVHAAVNRMLREDMYPHSVVVTDALWQRTLKTRLENGDLKKPQSTGVAVDNRFAVQAQKDLNKAEK
ncbi:MAG: ABC transporter substrate-binding protein, partial [Alphaproteobacteria bacterium]|nr:ABC transporter substrate-binding protein [Alphaproteobacteria bacterium]